ncbi:PKD domain-containing protein [Segetibacter aerophilus]|uniref:PKD domain-containing protein n=1 Tax=Segetibacter aerophilus TaxID=670293 RepID=UPI0014784602|nr:PKD domain-containing protein [Segetibacter aerophilus]
MSLLSLHIYWKKFLFFLFILFCSVAKGQLVADFTLDIRQGCAPFVVPKFTNLSKGTGLTYLWSFGNGNTSTQLNPGVIYFADGNYTVKLVVRDATGRKDSVVKSNFVTVNKSPAVNFAASRTGGCIPLTVQFTDLSTAGSGNITKWEWDFGDGKTSLLRSPSHTFDVTGNFTITLKVTNSLGCVEVNTKTSYIKVNEIPKANFTSGSATSCNPPVMVNFINTSTGPGIKSYKWNFGDGFVSFDQNPSHNYTTAGNYPVTLIITNENGCVDSIRKPTVIGAVTSRITVPDVICQGAPTSFLNASTPAVASSLWDFGDRTTSSEISPVKSFDVPGSYTVKLVNNFGGCKDSITKRITIIPKPVANFSYNAPPPGCNLPVTASFTSQASSAASYLWDFGDSTNSNASSPTHTYNSYGIFSAKLKVTAINGCSDSIVKPNVVSIIKVKINRFLGLPYAGCVPYQPALSADITTPNPISSYLWNFGGGQTSTEANPIHNYSKAGSYDMYLKVSTATGCTDSFQLKNAVSISDKPKVGFSAAPLSACASESVQFKNLTTGTFTSTKWEFGDGSTSEANDPLYHYADTGHFTVKLIIGNTACYDSLTMKDYVYVKPPIANFGVLFNCDSPLTRRFQNKSVVAKTYEWNFGDGSAVSTDENPTHTFAASGIYYVRLHVTNGDCFDDITDTLEVIGENPDFTVSSSLLCRNNPTVFTAKITNSQNVATYSWDFGDNSNVVTTTSPTIDHNYVIAGTYSPALTITDRLGCTQRVQKPASITIYGPIAKLTHPEGTCINSSLTFLDSSIATANHPITSWMLNYGDGKFDTSKTVYPTFVHTYTGVKNYEVFLVVTDDSGCKDTLFSPGGVNITDPKALFSLKDSISCSNSNIDFSNQSNGFDLSYAWDFGDGQPETVANPSHPFAAEGTYNISLAIKDRYGCTDTLQKLNAIIIQNAKAAFAMSDSNISCPPAQINFSDNSTYATSLKWDFDDGNFSDISNPSHYFLAARDYNIKLTAYGHGACADSLVRTVTVKGPSGTIAYDPIIKCLPALINFTGTAANNDNTYTWDFGDGTAVTTSEPAISHEYTSIGKYLPKLLLIDTKLKCTVSIFGSDSIIVPEIISYMKAPKNLFCDSATLRFFDSSVVRFDQISNYQWSFGDGTTSDEVSPFHNYTAPGIYPVRLTVTTTAGCTDSSTSSFVKIVKSPELEVTGPIAVCINQPAQYSATVKDTSAVRWNWNFGNGASSINPSPPAQVYTTAGSFSINTSVTNTSGCTTSKITPQKVNALPNVSAGVDSAICLGATITLNASGADNYLWTSNTTLSCSTCSTPVATPVNPVVYYSVTGTDAATSCQKTDSVQIKVVQPFKITTTVTDTLCIGESVKLFVTGADTYNWTPAADLNDPTSSTPVATPRSTTTYTVTGHDYLNCFTDVATIPITVYPIPVFNIIEDNITIAIGNSAPIKTKSSADVINWQWFPTTGLSCSNCAETVTTPTNTIVYKAIATNEGGCKAEDRITINVFCNNGNLFVPNTFSPNNDGSNDIFYPRGKGIAGVKSLQIFNRWGSQVFQKTDFAINDPSSGWDGTFNGKPQEPNVFVYQIEVICETGQVFSFKGDVTLIR